MAWEFKCKFDGVKNDPRSKIDSSNDNFELVEKSIDNERGLGNVYSYLNIHQRKGNHIIYDDSKEATQRSHINSIISISLCSHTSDKVKDMEALKCQELEKDEGNCECGNNFANINLINSK